MTLVSLIAARLTPRARVNRAVLDRLAHLVGWLALGLLALRWWRLMGTPVDYTPAETEAMLILTRGRLSFNFWGLEIVLGMLIPAILLLVGPFRRNERARLVALALVAVGVVAFRWDTNLVGQLVVYG